jgi:protein SCO1
MTDSGAGTSASPAPVPPSQPAGRRKLSAPYRFGLALVGGMAFASLVAFGLTSLHGKASPPAPMRPTGIPANVSTAVADLMQLSPVPHAAAPGFTLTDQAGRQVTLASLRGRVVVLTFMDSHCVDICPLVSREFRDAEQDLGGSASRVVFIAVNVNPYHLAVADVAAFSRAEQLDSIGSWHFVTGPVSALRQVWSAYQVQVIAPNPNKDVIHTSLVYFIDAAGRERYVAAPMADHTAAGKAFLPPGELASWGRGIALVARDISHLSKAERIHSPPGRSQMVKARFAAICLARSMSPPSSMPPAAAAGTSRPPASRKNNEDGSASVAVGSPSSASTTLARPSTTTRSSRSSGPVNLISTELPSGARASLPTT